MNDDLREALRKEYNAAVANGFLRKAKFIERQLQSLPPETIPEDPTSASEAVHRALIMIMQRTPRAGAAEQFIRWLEQDGYTVVKK